MFTTRPQKSQWGLDLKNINVGLECSQLERRTTLTKKDALPKNKKEFNARKKHYKTYFVKESIAGDRTRTDIF